MIRIDDRTVELDEVETAASELFDARLDDGADISTAVDAVEAAFDDLSPEFIGWLRGVPCIYCSKTYCHCSDDVED